MWKTISMRFIRKVICMLTIDFINVGYGDAILIREIKDGVPVFAALIDCGDAETGKQISSGRIQPADFLAMEGISHLDLLIVTHLHLDHAGGLGRIADEIGISRHFCNYIPDTTFWGKTFSIPEGSSEGAARLIQSANIFSRALCSMSQKGADIRLIHETCSFSLWNTRFSIYAPDPALNFLHQGILDELYRGNIQLQKLDILHELINDTSLCLRVEYAGRSFLLTSDISAAKFPDSSRCTVLKVPHHGHGDSMTPGLAAVLDAEYAVISVSNDRKDNCPDAEIIKMLAVAGTKVLITDQPGGTPSIRFTVTESGQLFCSR